MSADSHTGRNSNNGGSDTKKHYAKGGAMEQFQRSSVTPATPNMNRPNILDTPKTPTSNGIIKDR